jgi:hypothetical protein
MTATSKVIYPFYLLFSATIFASRAKKNKKYAEYDLKSGNIL